jgi:dienelactone hydrolase
LMPKVRDVARRLAGEGRVLVTQRGEVRDADTEWRGPIRIAQPRKSASGSI